MAVINNDITAIDEKCFHSLTVEENIPAIHLQMALSWMENISTF